jgi:hypothetical protein
MRPMLIPPPSPFSSKRRDSLLLRNPEKALLLKDYILSRAAVTIQQHMHYAHYALDIHVASPCLFIRVF